MMRIVFLAASFLRNPIAEQECDEKVDDSLNASCPRLSGQPVVEQSSSLASHGNLCWEVHESLCCNISTDVSCFKRDIRSSVPSRVPVSTFLPSSSRGCFRRYLFGFRTLNGEALPAKRLIQCPRRTPESSANARFLRISFSVRGRSDVLHLCVPAECEEASIVAILQHWLYEHRLERDIAQLTSVDDAHGEALEASSPCQRSYLDQLQQLTDLSSPFSGVLDYCAKLGFRSMTNVTAGMAVEVCAPSACDLAGRDEIIAATVARTQTATWAPLLSQWRPVLPPLREVRADFVIGGFPRCGSTSLRRILSKSTCVGIGKDESQLLWSMLRHEPFAGSPQAVLEANDEMHQTSSQNCLRGLAFPHAAMIPDALSGLAAAGSKIILTVRDPVEWLESWYNFELLKVRMGENRSLMENGWNSSTLFRLVVSGRLPDAQMFFVRREHGNFANIVQDAMLPLFGSENILLLDFQDSVSNTEAMVKRVSKFLGIDSSGYNLRLDAYTLHEFKANSRKFAYPESINLCDAPDLLHELQTYYAPQFRALPHLFRLLGGGHSIFSRANWDEICASRHSKANGNGGFNVAFSASERGFAVQVSNATDLEGPESNVDDNYVALDKCVDVAYETYTLRLGETTWLLPGPQPALGGPFPNQYVLVLGAAQSWGALAHTSWPQSLKQLLLDVPRTLPIYNSDVINFARGGLGVSDLLEQFANRDLQTLVRNARLVVVQALSARSGTLPGEERLRMVTNDQGILQSPFIDQPWFETDAKPTRVEAHLQHLLATDPLRFRQAVGVMQSNWVTQMQELGAILHKFQRPALLVYISSRRAPSGTKTTSDPFTHPHLVTESMLRVAASSFSAYSDVLLEDYGTFPLGETLPISQQCCNTTAAQSYNGSCYYSDVRQWTMKGDFERICRCDFVWRPVSTYPSTRMQFTIADRIKRKLVEMVS